MSDLQDPDRLLRERGVARPLDAVVVAACFERGGSVAAFALGDGTLRLAPRRGEEWITSEAHDGAVLALAPDCRPGSFLSGGDDGLFRRVGTDGSATTLASHGGRWVEQVASHPDPKSGVLACVAGKRAHLHDAAGGALKSFEHPSTVTGLAFDAKGKRLACSHYNGATLWFVAAKVDSPRRLEWKGSHTGVALHPGGDALVTAMQDNALHGWRLADGQHMRMSGYPAKCESMSFSRTGKWLASAGAESVVLWPFHGGGPMGKAPTELAGGDGVICTRVGFHPGSDMLAAGFSDGLVVLADVSSERILPVAAPGRGPVTALSWSPEGGALAFGTETGFAAVVELS